MQKFNVEHFKTKVYKCPYEGKKCKGGKHCHILETYEKLPLPLFVAYKCPVKNGKKIPLQIGI